MNQQCLCDYSSEEYFEGKKEDEGGSGAVPNRIFLNFTREYRHPAKDRFNQEKTKELFKYLRERPDLQEMKVSGWLDRKEETESENIREEEDLIGENDEFDDDECKNEEDSFYDESSSRRGGGQRFAMSRDFWYRKLNTLKAQKLDEAALEAEDLPRNDKSRPPKCIRYIKKEKIYADQVPPQQDEMIVEMDRFEEIVAKPVEENLKSNFVNVYDNRETFRNNPQ